MKQIYVAGVCCGFITYIISVFLVGFAFDTLDPLHIGLKLNTISKDLDEEHVYTNGRYFVGVGNEFLEYPRTYINMLFSDDLNADSPAISFQTQEGPVSVEFSLQYTLNATSLLTIYRRHNLEYHATYVNKVKSKVQERIASEFRPAAFYEARQDVANFLFRNAVEALSDEAVTIHDLQLRQADLPPTVEDKINEALRLEEDGIAEKNVQARQSIESRTVVYQNRFAQEVRIFESTKLRDAAVLLADSRSRAIRLLLDAEAKAINIVTDTLGFSHDEALKLFWLEKLPRFNKTVTVGFTPGGLVVPSQ